MAELFLIKLRIKLPPRFYPELSVIAENSLRNGYHMEQYQIFSQNHFPKGKFPNVQFPKRQTPKV